MLSRILLCLIACAYPWGARATPADDISAIVLTLQAAYVLPDVDYRMSVPLSLDVSGDTKLTLKVRYGYDTEARWVSIAVEKLPLFIETPSGRRYRECPVGIDLSSPQGNDAKSAMRVHAKQCIAEEDGVLHEPQLVMREVARRCAFIIAFVRHGLGPRAAGPP